MKKSICLLLCVTILCGIFTSCVANKSIEKSSGITLDALQDALSENKPVVMTKTPITDGFEITSNIEIIESPVTYKGRLDTGENLEYIEITIKDMDTSALTASEAMKILAKSWENYYRNDVKVSFCLITTLGLHELFISKQETNEEETEEPFNTFDVISDHVSIYHGGSITVNDWIITGSCTPDSATIKAQFMK